MGETASRSSSSSESGNTTDQCPDSELRVQLHIPLAVVYSLICVLGLAGNLVALWVFSIKSRKNSIRVLLKNLVFADLLLVVCLPFRISYHAHGNIWGVSPILCTVVSCLFYTNMYISIILLGLISVNRYLKINHSTGMQPWLVSPQGTRILCAGVWVGVSSFTLTVYTYHLGTDNKCFQYKSLLKEKWKAYINMLGVVIFWLVFVALMVSYGKIAHKLLKKSHEMPGFPNASHYVQSAKKSFFILFVFTFCFVPYHLFRVFYIQTQITDTSCFWSGVADIGNEVALLFTASNSCLDPIMYFLLSSSVRKEMLRMANSVFRVRDAGRIKEHHLQRDEQES